MNYLIKIGWALSCFCFLTSNAFATRVINVGSLWGMGYNLQGNLGIGNYISTGTNPPVEIVLSNVTAIAGGGYHTLFLKIDGSLWGMGDEGSGQLGDGTFNSTGVDVPEMIVASNVTAIAAGEFHSLFLKNDGSLWGMGDESYGELGNGTFGSSPYYAVNRPVMIATNVAAIAAGGSDSFFIKYDGSLWAMGYDNHGQLGNGTFNSTGIDTPQMIVSNNVANVSAGSAHTLFTKNDGSLWGTGYNGYGQLGDGTYGGTYAATNLPEKIVSNNVVTIAAGYDHSLFIKSDGSLWAMGDDYNGQLGDGNYGGSINLPEQIVASNVTAIAAGEAQSLFQESYGSLWAMGANQYGELGDGTTSETNRPEEIIYNSVLAISSGYAFSLFIKSVITPSPPFVAGVSPSGTNLVINAYGAVGGIYLTLMSPSLSPPQWTPIATNVLSAGGAFSVTVTNGFSVNNPHEYFLLELQ